MPVNNLVHLDDNGLSSSLNSLSRRLDNLSETSKRNTEGNRDIFSALVELSQSLKLSEQKSEANLGILAASLKIIQESCATLIQNLASERQTLDNAVSTLQIQGEHQTDEMKMLLLKTSDELRDQQKEGLDSLATLHSQQNKTHDILMRMVETSRSISEREEASKQSLIRDIQQNKPKPLHSLKSISEYEDELSEMRAKQSDRRSRRGSVASSGYGSERSSRTSSPQMLERRAIMDVARLEDLQDEEFDDDFITSVEPAKSVVSQMAANGSENFNTDQFMRSLEALASAKTAEEEERAKLTLRGMSNDLTRMVKNEEEKSRSGRSTSSSSSSSSSTVSSKASSKASSRQSNKEKLVSDWLESNKVEERKGISALDHRGTSSLRARSVA